MAISSQPLSLGENSEKDMHKLLPKLAQFAGEFAPLERDSLTTDSNAPSGRPDLADFLTINLRMF
jgi:hypothetical protein